MSRAATGWASSCGERPDVPLVHLAAWKLAAISVPLTTQFGPDALGQRLRDAAPKVLVCEARDLDRVSDVSASIGDKVRDGWIRMGDLGARDADGFFWYRSRTDDVISSSGYRIGPSKIEECLISHPAVRLSAAVGVPDPVRGEVVKAFVELNAGFAPSEALADELQSRVRARLAPYLCPRLVEFVEAIPLTTTGKVRRSELRGRDRGGAGTTS